MLAVKPDLNGFSYLNNLTKIKCLWLMGSLPSKGSRWAPADTVCRSARLSACTCLPLVSSSFLYVMQVVGSRIYPLPFVSYWGASCSCEMQENRSVGELSLYGCVVKVSPGAVYNQGVQHRHLLRCRKELKRVWFGYRARVVSESYLKARGTCFYRGELFWMPLIELQLGTPFL